MITVSALRKKLGLKAKTGRVDVNKAYSINYIPIEYVEFSRYNVVRYYTTDGKLLSVFQDSCGFDQQI